MSDLIVIGLCGKARSGKDSAAGVLSLMRGCYRIALADGIRSAIADLGAPSQEILKELNGEHNYRRALQTLGTEARDSINAPGLWIHLLLAKIHYAAFIHPVSRRRFVIPDVRFRLERGMIEHQVNRWQGKFGLLRLCRGMPEIAESGHVSETEVEAVPCHWSYANDKGIEDLGAVVCRFFDAVAAGKVGSDDREKVVV